MGSGCAPDWPWLRARLALAAPRLISPCCAPDWPWLRAILALMASSYLGHNALVNMCEGALYNSLTWPMGCLLRRLPMAGRKCPISVQRARPKPERERGCGEWPRGKWAPAPAPHGGHQMISSPTLYFFYPLSGLGLARWTLIGHFRPAIGSLRKRQPIGQVQELYSAPSRKLTKSL
jgi:hypothetical protein